MSYRADKQVIDTQKNVHLNFVSNIVPLISELVGT